MNPAPIEAYVDGSYQDGKVGYGAVILQGQQVVAELSGPVQPEHAGDSRNVAGELYAVGYVLRWCAANAVQNITIYHDYEGLSAWAEGRWKAKTPIVLRYLKFLSESTVRIRWVKVRAHSDNPLNDRADTHARAGAALAERAAAVDEMEMKLRDVLERFADELARLGIQAEYEGFLNRQFGRLRIGTGRLDLYHSSRNPWKSHFTGVKDIRVHQTWMRIRAELGD
jgi:ribonuclease HI